MIGSLEQLRESHGDPSARALKKQLSRITAIRSLLSGSRANHVCLLRNEFGVKIVE